MASLLAERTQLLQRDRAGAVGEVDALLGGGTVLHLAQEAIFVLDDRGAVDDDRVGRQVVVIERLPVAWPLAARAVTSLRLA